MSVKTALVSAKPTPKVAAQTTAGTITGLITWLLVTTYWKTGLPAEVAAALPGIVAIVWGFAQGWLTKENIVIPPLGSKELSMTTVHDPDWLTDAKLPGPNGREFWKPGENDGLPIAAFAAGNLMEDDTSTSQFTPGCAAYAGYYDGNFANMTAVRAYAAGQNARSFAYTGRSSTSGADALDMEPGLASASDFPAFYHGKGGKNVYGYGSASWVSSIVNAATAAGIPRSAYKIVSAHYIGEHICGPSTCGYPQADATQFTDTYLGRSLDCTVFNSTFWGTVTPPPPPPPTFPLKLGDSNADVKTTQENLNKWAKPIKLTTALVADGSFGALTEAAVKLALVHFDYSAANVVLGEVPQSLFDHLAAAVPVTPPPPPPPPPPTTTAGLVVYVEAGKLVQKNVISTNLTTWTA